MKAIYKKPEMEIVHLQVEEDIAYAQFGKNSVNEDRASGNSGFFDDEQSNNGNANFFDD